MSVCLSETPIQNWMHIEYQRLTQKLHETPTHLPRTCQGVRLVQGNFADFASFLQNSFTERLDVAWGCLHFAGVP